jgi:hypothetical protein
VKRTWPWLLVPAALAVLALAAVQGFAADPSAPAGAPSAGGNGVTVPVPIANATDASDTDGDAGPRQPAAAPSAGTGADERVAHVRVRLVEQRGSGAPSIPLPHVDIALRSDGEVTVARTDLVGEAQFAVAGAHGRTATVACLLGAARDVVLSATEPRFVELVLQPALRVQGRVETASGQPVGGAALVWLPFAGIGGDAPAPWRAGRSRSDGTFDLGVASDGQLGAAHHALGVSAMFAVQRGTGEAAAPVLALTLVLLGDAAQVQGTVRDAREQPVPFAEVQLRALDPPAAGAAVRAVPARVRADATGRWSARVAAGLVELSARARGHGAFVASRRLAPGAAVTWDVALAVPCTLRGVVRDASGAGVAALVTAGADGSFAAVRGSTGAGGAFVLDGLVPGPVAVAAIELGGERRVVREQLVLAPGETVWEPRFGDARDGLVGTLRDAAGRPLHGWLVAVRAAAGKAPTATTGPDGTFRLGGSLPPRVDLRAYARGRSPGSGFADAVLRDVDPAAGPVQWTVPPPELGRIAARVEGPGQAGVPARITCWHHERAERVIATANADGTVLLHDVPAGTLDLAFEHARLAAAARRGVAVARGEQKDLGTIALGVGGVLFGEVRGPAGEVPPECELTLVALPRLRFDAAYSGGTYRFPPAPPGAYQLLVQCPGLAGWSWPVTVVADQETQQNVVLAAGVPRRVRVELPPGAPGAFALALKVPGKPGVASMTTGGVQRVPGAAHSVPFVLYMPPGAAYEAVAWADGWEARTTLRFVAGDDAEVTLRLQPVRPLPLRPR